MTTTPASPSSTAVAAEAFLRTFHDSGPGQQSVGVQGAPLADGRTGYQVLAAQVAGARRVLDLGCADGALLEVLGAAGAEELAGIDLSEQELALAHARPALRGADLRQGRAQELPFADGSFDAVVSHMALMLMHDVDRVAAEAARVLVPGGRFAVAVGGGPVEGEALSLFLDLARPYFKAAPPERSLPRLGNPKVRKRETLDGLLGPAGFAPVSWDTVVLDMGGTPEEVWASNAGGLYDMVALDEEQTARLRGEFLAAAPALQDADGRVPSGMRLNIAVTDLRPVATG
ncbi:ubiquinone/menaquinone biosynthesis C-methylase UbiE [Streptomyces sp. KhCrAH-43]|uniref:class I SAM-dependent methyltransferase n=1 Tax=Streptomyces TaxID=1883 RepID=UPI00037F69F9|nr:MULTISPECIES: class I SAM-dependent methyltransferase [unclassified Streptomyces]MYS34583.1 methyltransferase domain-containing protein [Streptomyces sp. SID4920]MYX65640.1 methyltransferase domain-containing protein [Streptomyces sp. SID8373]RAJ64384.1 ubiquinone/menaquinone biosynthesis C-methylase UbiE [Streptomyces sp. KhCrAH-43]